jgi:hypothetical protein
MQTSKCFCLLSIWAVFGDLRQAVERMEREISDSHVKQWMQGYRDGLCAAQERFRLTQGKCCCERTADAIGKGGG